MQNENDMLPFYRLARAIKKWEKINCPKAGRKVIKHLLDCDFIANSDSMRMGENYEKFLAMPISPISLAGIKSYISRLADLDKSGLSQADKNKQAKSILQFGLADIIADAIKQAENSQLKIMAKPAFALAKPKMTQAEKRELKALPQSVADYRQNDNGRGLYDNILHLGQLGEMQINAYYGGENSNAIFEKTIADKSENQLLDEMEKALADYARLPCYRYYHKILFIAGELYAKIFG